MKYLFILMFFGSFFSCNYFEKKKLNSETILIEEYLPEVIFDGSYELENGKIIRRIYINHTEKFSIYNKNTCLLYTSPSPRD